MRRDAGLTLLETMIVLVIVSAVAFVAGSALLASVTATNEMNVEHDLLSAGDRGLAVIERELRNTSFAAGGKLSTPTALTLTFCENTGFDTVANQPTWGQPITYSFILSPAETARVTTSVPVKAYQLVRSSGTSQTIVADCVIAPSFSINNNCVSVDFTVARTIYTSGQRKKEVRTRPVSRVYRLPS